MKQLVEVIAKSLEATDPNLSGIISRFRQV